MWVPTRQVEPVLTPRERATLARIEQQLLLDDPAFAARLQRARPPRTRRPVVVAALSLISLVTGLAVLLILGSVVLMGQPVPARAVVGLSLLALASGVGYVVLRFVPGPELP